MAGSLGRIGTPEAEKARGAFYTPPAIASFLANWAVSSSEALVLDPTCGNGIFLQAAATRLTELASGIPTPGSELYGVDVHGPALREADAILAANGSEANLLQADFFQLPVPGDMFATLPAFDAVIGNPPFIRYQTHSGAERLASRQAALRQGVRLSGLASSWAALLVHAGGFLKADGRLAMVLPAELLTVGYAEPVRQWLRQRFAAVKLVLFERLQFDGALENVVLLLAQGSGGCDAFSLYYVQDAEDLSQIQRFDEFAVTLAPEGKWTDMLLTIHERQLFKTVAAEHFVGLGKYGNPALGTVTGANDYFTLSESTRLEYELVEGRDVARISPPGTRHLRGLTFTKGDWDRLRSAGDQVWMLYPNGDDDLSSGLRRYLTHGESLSVPDAYKCQTRSRWWRPPMVTPPDLFFTYMSHRYPRLITNRAKVSFVNSMHGVRLRPDVPAPARDALPLLALNSVTLLGAEVFGRSYGGGILKMEPREAATLPMPSYDALERAWEQLKPDKSILDRQLRNGLWTNVVARVDEVLLMSTLGFSHEVGAALHEAARSLRTRRMGRGAVDAPRK